MYYAQIDAQGRCYAVTQTAGPVQAGNMIPIDGYDESYLGRVYSEGAWTDAPAP